MSYFRLQHQDFGTVKTGEAVTVEFVKIDGAPKVRSTQGTCHCTNPIDYEDRVSSTYTGEGIAPGSAGVRVSKRVVVNFSDGTVENLLITGTLLPK